MSYVLTNLEFELALSGAPIPKAVRAMSARWSHILRLLEPEAEVVVWPPTAGSQTLEPGRRLVAWGWTDEVLAFAEKAGLEVGPVDVGVVREVNDKRFGLGIEALAGSAVCGSEAELAEAVRGLEAGWVLKHPFGVSGRGQLRGRGSDLPDDARRWAQRVFGAGLGVVVEPRVEIEAERSLHFEIEAGGAVRELGMCALMADATGTFRGLGLGSAVDVLEEDALLWEGARKAARAVAERGYVGPVGVDAYVGWYVGERVVRAVSEINARVSFGRLGLALLGRLGWEGARWVHPVRSGRSGRSERGVGVGGEGGAGEGGVCLPESVDPAGRSGTYVV
ncbi:hypothetical protein FRC96_08475 [Lujinxingia vulgaris]|uniref:ATP-grasp domain-containing protein n=1 Tax=Lujinxingia vulgaris TaxID=2600176 RepID=A0A5C6XCC7_9DELT|nr:hypothetical protein [Lujinxingia vulgaris]TXD37367.1 hypothetical protein FRC96_08475 [Lujinxingia vulgaris]